jgi:hypothetical protein
MLYYRLGKSSSVLRSASISAGVLALRTLLSTKSSIFNIYEGRALLHNFGATQASQVIYNQQ